MDPSHTFREKLLARRGTGRRIGTHPWAIIAFAAALVAGIAGTAGAASTQSFNAAAVQFESLDGTGNNAAHPNQGAANTQYPRVAPANYKDGISQSNNGPNERLISNRIMSDHSQNVFSENGATQWVWQWGQFVDHDIALAAGGDLALPKGNEKANIAFNAKDPMEGFHNDLGVIGFTRDSAAPGTGTSTSNPRQAINTISSYEDASNVYGNTRARLDWLRDGSLDGNPDNNKATIMLQGGFLPTRDARGNVNNAPLMFIDGRLRATPAKATVAGDVRANENIGLNATQTLFAREHNRIVSKLPNTLTDEQKFQIARAVVIGEQQFITYNEFLPAAGVRLPAYTGYKSNVDASIGTEFATAAYRAHSMVHGEFEMEVDNDRYTPAQLQSFEDQGLEVEAAGDETKIAVPLNVMFFNSPLLRQIGLGPLLESIGGEAQYNNDEMFDNHMRSILFQVPNSPTHQCQEPVDPNCFSGVTDLAAIDIARAFDHGIPTYNNLRKALGLAPKTSFRGITGESTENFPAGLNADNPASLDFTTLRDKNGAPIDITGPVANTDATVAIRRTTKAARLKAVFGSVDKVDAFTGILSEAHVSGTNFGELQLAMWKKQFTALRDGDRFFYQNNPVLTQIRNAFGIDFRQNLGDIIAANTDIARDDMRPNVFQVPANEPLDQNRVFNGNSGRCLDVPFSNQTNGTQVQIWDCNATGAQNWQQLPGTGQIRVFANKCLDVFSHRTAAGSPVTIFDCNNQTNQVFRFQSNGLIVGLESGRCLVSHGNGTARGTKLEIQNCNVNNPAQRWIR